MMIITYLYNIFVIKEVIVKMPIIFCGELDMFAMVANGKLVALIRIITNNHLFRNNNLIKGWENTCKDKTKLM